MGMKIFFGLLFLLLVVILLSFYWFIPLSNTEFISQFSSSDSILENNSGNLQFYENMRFPTSRISYHINNCSLQKKDDMLRAFEILSSKTILNFYESNIPEITIVCESKNKIEGGLFIAGEGGPVNITKAGEFNIITKGKILLIKESSCPNPNIAIHELLHVLGFDHSSNPNDLMYAISKCDQEINPNVINIINTLYSIPSYPDLAFENVSAVMKGKYMNINISIRNKGFQNAPYSQVLIYTDDKLVKTIDFDPLVVGNGRVITLTNVWISKISIDKVRLIIKADFEELKKRNNEIVLEGKK